MTKSAIILAGLLLAGGTGAHATALVTQTRGGTMSVVPNLSNHDCAEARNIALYGQTLEETKKAEDEEKARTEAIKKTALDWLAAHPKADKQCERYSFGEITCYDRKGNIVFSGSWGYDGSITSYSIDQYNAEMKDAECVK